MFVFDDFGDLEIIFSLVFGDRLPMLTRWDDLNIVLGSFESRFETISHQIHDEYNYDKVNN